MALTSDERDRVAEAIVRTQGATAEDQVKAIEHALGVPSQKGTDVIWVIIISGLVAALLITVVALTHWLGDGPDDKILVPIATAITTGLFGLMAKTPSS